MHIQQALIAAVCPVGELLDPFTSSIHFPLHIVKLSVAFCVNHQVIPLQAGVVDHIVPAVHASAVAGLGVVDPNTKPVVGVAGLVALPVRAFHQAVGLVVDECAGFFLPGLRHAVPALVVGVGIVLVLGAAAYQLVQLVVLVIGRFILHRLRYQVAQGVIGISRQFFGDVAGHHPVQLIVGVDMRALIRLVGRFIGTVFRSRVFRYFRRVRVVVLIRFLPTVQSWRHMAAVVDDVAVFIHVLSGRYFPVLVITEVFRVPLRIGLRYRAVQGVILIGTFSK